MVRITGLLCACLLKIFKPFIGGHVKVAEAFQIVEDQLEKIKPDTSISVTPPSEPWFPSSELQLGIGSDEEISKSVAKDSKFAALFELESKLNSILSEDSSHLLRKAQSVVSKAMTKI